jgi:3-phosphoshikimate 1-carboxyvinyltransferase
MREQISPARALSGAIQLPGDKSISHRYGMLAAIAEGVSKIENYSTGADCQSTLACMQALGARVEKQEGSVSIEGRGLDGLHAPSAMLDAGNSGSTIRMLSGILAAQRFDARIGGDESLSRRPMERIMKPLAEMGASIEARENRFPPLTIRGTELHPIEYTLPVASAQVKSCVLLAGLYADGRTIINEPVRTRDHTELALREFGAELDVQRKSITLTGRPRLTARDLRVPGDLSSAAFFLVAALIVAESDLTIRSVGLNPTRSALLDFLAEMGAAIKVLDITQTAGELIGDVSIKKSRIRGGVLEKARTAALIDEIPVLAVLGAASEDGLSAWDWGSRFIRMVSRCLAASISMPLRSILSAITALPWPFPSQPWLPTDPAPSPAPSQPPCLFPNFSLHYIESPMAVADLTLEGLIHDLNNVFQTIGENADLLESDPKWQKVAQTLQRSVHRGQRIVHSILETTGAATELSPVIENATQFCQDYLECANSQRIGFTQEIDREFHLKGDPAQWERVLVNLFLNSAQAGAKNIHVEARQQEIVVSDDGPGISPELLPRIFQPRVSTKSIISGLGLYVVQSIVEQNGGTVSAANGPSGGAVFTLHV